MIKIRFVNEATDKEEPHEFKSWNRFYLYLAQRWGYSPHDFKKGSNKVNETEYRYTTWKFVMVLEETNGNPGRHPGTD